MLRSAASRRQECAPHPKLSSNLLYLRLCCSIARFISERLNREAHRAPWRNRGVPEQLRHSFTLFESCSGTFRMRRAEVGKLLQNVGVGFEARGRALIFRQEGEAVIDHVVCEDTAVGIRRRLGRIET